MNRDVMVDCETLGVGNQPVILSIGAISFGKEVESFGRTFEININPESYDGYGGQFEITASTVKWWMGQSEEAREAAFGKGVHIRDALESFSEYLTKDGCSPVLWANDETADLVWLESAYRIVGLPTPWTFRDHRCFRTIKDIAGMLDIADDANDYAQKAGAVAHNALDDAVWQARYTAYVLEHIKN